MTYSKYTDSVMLAHSSNYTATRNSKILRITPHHMAGNLSAETCAKLFQQPGRGGSANYCIDGSGKVVCSVPEESRAWTSSSSTNDNQAVTFELANSGLSPDWPVSDACLNKFIDVTVDICQRYGIGKLIKGQNLTWHSQFASTVCPGPYLLSKMDWIAATVNARLSKSGWYGSGETQQFYSNGTLIKGWFRCDNSWFYADQDGYILFGWHKLRDSHGDLWRYFNPENWSGRMLEGLQTIDGLTYYLRPDIGSPSHVCEELFDGFDPTIKIG